MKRQFPVANRWLDHAAIASAALFVVLAVQTGCANSQQDFATISNKPTEANAMMQADRLPPAEVPPVTMENIKFVVVHWGKERGLGQNGGYIEAIEATTGKKLWLLKIYDVHYDPDMEEDVQDIFIKSMKKTFFSNKLKISDERGRKYLVDPSSRSVEAD